MAFGVFVHRTDSIYEDSPAEQYQFPRQYITRVRACVGNWIVYYEPVKAPSSRGYFAVAKVQEIIPDPRVAGMYRALIEPGSYLDFEEPAPFRHLGLPVERGLLNEHGVMSGRAQAAVRGLAEADFSRILDLAFIDERSTQERTDSTQEFGFREPQAAFRYEDVEERLRTLTSRLVRDRVFRTVVLKAYDQRCALSGLRLINGGGRAEVEAAHIQPVHAKGPDVVNNGLALSGTAHWMFDRGLISLSDDLAILVSRHVNDPVGVHAFLNRSGRARMPCKENDRPHPHFLAWHRQNCFKT